jgi:uncharacterized membrane protein
MVAGIMYGVREGIAIVPVFAFLAGLAILFLLKRSIGTVIEDEWTRLVEGRAALMSLNSVAVLFTLIGLFLATVSGPDRNYDQAVYAIAGFLIIQAVAQVAFTLYYRRTLRGTVP